MWADLNFCNIPKMLEIRRMANRIIDVKNRYHENRRSRYLVMIGEITMQLDLLVYAD